MGSLNTLNLSKNNLRNITQSKLRGLKNLLTLDLSSNKLNFYDSSLEEEDDEEDKKEDLLKSGFDSRWQNFKRTFWAASENLKPEFMTSYIEKDSFKNLINLSFLNLNDNDISFLSPGAFKHLKKLEKLNFSNNKIKKWNTPVFGNNILLNYLDLRYNNIETLTKAMIKDFSNPNLVIDFRFNLFSCSCSLHTFENELNRTRFIGKKNYKCWDGKKVINIRNYLNLTEPCPEITPLTEAYTNAYIHKVWYAFLGVITIVCVTVAMVTYRNRW